MSAFSSTDFLYDNTPSEIYGLVITSLSEQENVVSAGSSISTVTDKVFRSPTYELVAVDYSEPLSFDVEFSSEKPLDKYDIESINAWLSGSHEYKILQICQEDLKNIYYNCLITDMSNVYYNNRGHSFRCKVVCDAPWAWEFDKDFNWSFPNTQNNKINFFNTSGYNGTLKPVVEFTLTNSNTNFTIINHSLNNLKFEWKGLQGGETILVDNYTQEISSSLGIYRSDKFNKTFLELCKGYNDLEIIGTIKNVKFTIKNAKKVGA